MLIIKQLRKSEGGKTLVMRQDIRDRTNRGMALLRPVIQVKHTRTRGSALDMGLLLFRRTQ